MSILLAMAAIGGLAAETPQKVERLVFPLNPQHNHASCIIECPNGDLLVCWYRGSGERTADDVAVLGARLRKGRNAWSPEFVMADTPGFPDCNPCMVVDARSRLWLIWPVIVNNRWESALLRYSISSDYQRSASPRWTEGGVILLKPGEEFTAKVERDLARLWRPYAASASLESGEKLEEYLSSRTKAAADKLSMRLGWMPRPHPVILADGRMILPLYSDLFDFSLIAYSDDHGGTWSVSEPIVGPGNVQPAIAVRKDGTLVAYMRDNGPPPQRVIVSESSDRGHTWSEPRDIEIPDPGAGVDVVVLKSGRWVIVNNDTEEGRHSLALTISEDEGRSWPRKLHLEHDNPGPDAGSYSYPSIIQTRDGRIHVTYTYVPNAEARAALPGQGKTIKHVEMTEDWLLKTAVPR
ncbi:MAG: exo-alpha-sialidase [Chthonomonadales bacterium]|nr:exo-alpha-sialidase [Chthonomonadales bacterium]